jgi:4-amino-4-deoxy-L-arabinose transferase-like glycosyltransferase
VQVAISTATVGVVYAIAARAGGRRAGRIAGLLCALHPSLVAFSHYLYSETLFIGLLVPAVHLLHRSPGRSQAGELLASGLLFGLATLTRSLALFYLPLWAAWLFWRGDRAEARKVALVLAVCAAVVAPWTLRNAAVYGDFLLVDGTLGRTAYVASNGRPHPLNVDLGFGLDPSAPRRPDCPERAHPRRAELPPAQELLALVPEGGALDARTRARLPSKLERVRGFASQDTPALQRCEVAGAVRFVAAHPLWMLRQSAERLYAFWGPNSFLLRSVKKGAYAGGPLGPEAYPMLKWSFVAFTTLFVGAAILALGRGAQPPLVGWIVGFALYATLVHSLTVAWSRYQLPLVPFAIVLAGLWLARPTLPETRARRRAVLAALAAWVLLALHYTLARLP